MNAEFIVSEMFGTHFLRVPKECVKMWGGAKTLFFAYLYDIANFAKLQGEDSFYCTYSKIENDLGYDRHTISKYFKFFIELGILKKCENNSLKDRIFYQINCEAIVAMVKNHIVSNSKNNTFDSVKNPLVAVENSHLGGVENSHSYNNKESIKTDSIITNSAERILSKKEVKKSKIDLAKDFFLENSHKITNNHFDLDLWIKWIAYKIKKSRNFGSESFEFQFKKLLECESRAREAIEYSIGQGYQGLFLPNGNAKPQKYQYDPRKGNTGQSDFSDNPDDYINENMAGVKKIGDGIFEADLWKLTGRKQ